MNIYSNCFQTSVPIFTIHLIFLTLYVCQCRLLINLANSLDSDKARLAWSGSKLLIFWWFSWKFFFEKLVLKNYQQTTKSMKNYPACNELKFQKKKTSLLSSPSVTEGISCHDPVWSVGNCLTGRFFADRGSPNSQTSVGPRKQNLGGLKTQQKWS